ncbi:MAG: LPS export ABC transporter periplasmic protein LptC [Gammaproteobacteria bacterium]
MNFRMILFILILGLFAAGTWWLASQIKPPEISAPPPPTHEPDYYFTDATVTTLDKQGKRSAVMNAPRIIHHPDDDSSEVFAPHIEYFSASGPPWYSVADHGLMPSGGQLVKLDGHVEMRRPSASGGAPLVIHTDKLDVNLDTNIGTTADPVDIVQGQSHMTGIGMVAYLKEDRMILQSNVRGHYVRQH